MLDTLRWIKRETNVWLEITNLMIPGLNDAESETQKLAEWIGAELGAEVPLHFTAFHPDFKMRDIPRTPPSTLTRARQLAREVGLKYVYTGNVHDRAAGTTFCPACAAAVIERDWYAIDPVGLAVDAGGAGIVPRLRRAHRRPLRSAGARQRRAVAAASASSTATDGYSRESSKRLRVGLVGQDHDRQGAVDLELGVRSAPRCACPPAASC